MSRTNIMILLDRSWSMTPIAVPTRNAFNRILGTIQAGATQTTGGTAVGVITFGDSATLDLPLTAAGNLKPMKTFVPEGNTAMFDALRLARETIEAEAKPGDANVLWTITDGEDNHSTRWSAARFAAWQYDLRQRDDPFWTVSFSVPPRPNVRPEDTYKAKLIRMGVPEWNISEWEATEAGIAQAEEKTSASFVDFFAQRARGATKTDRFFRTQVDLGTLTDAEARRKASNLSGRFHLAQVIGTNPATGKAWPVREWYERYAGRAYVIGSVYYQLSKAEDVQPAKEVVIRSHISGEAFGGREARELIGLKPGVTARIVPANLGQWQVFVQSTSVNRLLPPGSFVLIDPMLTTSLTPTWDHTQVTTGGRV